MARRSFETSRNGRLRSRLTTPIGSKSSVALACRAKRTGAPTCPSTKDQSRSPRPPSIIRRASAKSGLENGSRYQRHFVFSRRQTRATSASCPIFHFGHFGNGTALLSFIGRTCPGKGRRVSFQSHSHRSQRGSKNSCDSPAEAILAQAAGCHCCGYCAGPQCVAPHK